jgi:uncharacterized membrane protein
MKKSNRQLVVGSLQPFLFCVGMYFVILIFSVFVCTSLYKAFHEKKSMVAMQKTEKPTNSVATAAMVAAIK